MWQPLKSANHCLHDAKHFFCHHNAWFIVIVLSIACHFGHPQVFAAGQGLLFLGNKNISPVVFLDNGQPSGVVVDIVKALANHIDQPIEIIAMDWAEAQSLVATGAADALIQKTKQKKES